VENTEDFISVIKDKTIYDRNQIYIIIGVLKNMKAEVTKNPKLLNGDDMIKLIKISTF